MKHKIFLVVSFYIRLFTSWLPDTPRVMRCRGKLYSLFMGSCGTNFQVAEMVTLRGLQNIHVGNNVYIGPNSTFFIRTGCFIEDNVLVGPNCVVVDSNHGFDGDSYRFARGNSGAVTIREGAWLAANVVVTHSTTINEKVVIPPNSVVRQQRSQADE